MTLKTADPYSPKARDPYDSAIDSVGRKLQPVPYRNGAGPDVLGPRNYLNARERQAPDMVRPPATDNGTMPNMKWSFADSHTRIEHGGWARQTTIRKLPTSKELLGSYIGTKRCERASYCCSIPERCDAESMNGALSSS